MRETLDCNIDVSDKVKNSRLLTNVFGRWPCFHDAEAISITLDRGAKDEFSPNLQAAINVADYELILQADGSRRYIQKNNVIVNFLFFGVTKLQLFDFNHQNVLQDIYIKEMSEQQLEQVKFEVVFESSFGVGAEFQCSAIEVQSVEVLPSRN